MNVANLIVGIVSAIAAALAAWFAFKGPTEKDLKKVEQNTAATSQRLEKVEAHIASVDTRLRDQQRYEMAISWAQRVAIHVTGEDSMAQPMGLTLKTKDPSIVITRVEMLNEIGTSFGSADCDLTAPLHHAATIENSVLQRWYSSGQPDQTVDRHRVRLRVHMNMEELDVFRDVPVHIRLWMRTRVEFGRNISSQVFSLEGNVA